MPRLAPVMNNVFPRNVDMAQLSITNPSWHESGQDLSYQAAMHVGQPHIAVTEAKRQLFMIPGQVGGGWSHDTIVNAFTVRIVRRISTGSAAIRRALAGRGDRLRHLKRLLPLCGQVQRLARIRSGGDFTEIARALHACLEYEFRGRSRSNTRITAFDY
jgi:hypothetical protein